MPSWVKFVPCALLLLSACSAKSDQQSARTDEASQSAKPYTAMQHSGYDQSGAFTSCTSFDPNDNCTSDYNAGDQFAQSCVEAGHLSFRCGCHEYLCGQKVELSGSKKPASATDRPELTIDGAQANLIVDSLSASGYKPAAQADGGELIKVDLLRCLVVIAYPFSHACVVVPDGGQDQVPMELSEDLATKLHATLVAGGAAIDKPENLTGSDHWAGAESLACLRREGQDKCTFKVEILE